MRFSKWVKRRQLVEMMGSVASIVGCGDLKNPNFQIQGALSNLKCRKKNERKIKSNKS